MVNYDLVKIRKISILFLAIISICFVFGIAKTYAEKNDFELENVEILEKSEGVTGEVKDFSNGKITNDVTFIKLNDYVIYGITIKNNSKEEYTIEKITDNNTNEYIKYIYDNYKDEVIKPSDTLTLKVKVEYTKLVDDDTKRIQDYSVKFSITYVDKNIEDGVNVDENGFKTEVISLDNPRTDDNIVIMVALLLVSIVGIVVLIIANKKSKLSFLSLIMGLVLLPFAVKAADIAPSFTFVNVHKLHDKIGVTLMVGNTTKTSYIEYNTNYGPISATLAGYEISGWNFENGEAYDPDLKLTDDTIVVAEATTIKYNISYTLNGGNADNTDKYTVEDELTLKEPTREGYTFTGWTGTDLDSETKTVTIKRGSTEDRSYTAHYTANSYAIKYDANGGNNTMSSQNMVYDISDNLRANTFTKSGYEFGGWNTKSNGSGDYYYDEEEVTNLAPKGEVKLFAQWVKPATLDTGSNVNSKMKNLANDADYYTSDYDEFIIQHITKANKLPNDYEITPEKTISTSDSNTPVYIWFDDTTNTIYWFSQAKTIYMNSDSGHMFEEMECLEEVEMLKYLDSSNITSLERMFSYTWEADYDGIDNLDTSNVTTMEAAFRGTNFEQTDLIAGWNTENVTTMKEMFSTTHIASTSALGGWNTSSVTTMEGMFENNYYLTDLTGLSGWNTSNVTNMSSMFYYARYITLNELSELNVSNVTDMSRMFQSSGITDLTPISGWDVRRATDISRMFWGTGISTLNGLNNWKLNRAENLAGLFSNCYSLTDISGIGNWGLPGHLSSNMNNLSQMFSSCSNLVDISPLSNWQGMVYNVTNTSNMFSGCGKLENISPIYNWSLSGVKNTSDMFRDCYKLTGNFLVRNIYTSYSGMFSNAGRDTNGYINVDYPMHPGGNLTSEQLRDFIWDNIVGRPYRYNEHVSIGMAVYH